MSEQDIEKLIADHAALQSENAVLKEELALMQEQMRCTKSQICIPSLRTVMFRLTTTVQRMQFVRSRSGVRTGCIAIRQTAHRGLRSCIRFWQLHRRTG